VNAFDRRHPSQRRYYRNVRNAMIVAAVAHAAVLAFAPMPLPPVPQMGPSVMRMVETSGLLLSAAVSSSRPATSSADGPLAPGLPAKAEAIREVREPVSTMPASEVAPSATGTAMRSGTGHGSALPSGSGVIEDGPAVFYAYDTAPRPTHRVEPTYPVAARNAGYEGTVVVNLNIDERGRVLRGWVAEARAADVLVEAALDAAYEFTFEPGTWRGEPVKCTVSIPFQFRLNQTLEVEGP